MTIDKLKDKIKRWRKFTRTTLDAAGTPTPPPKREEEGDTHGGDAQTGTYDETTPSDLKVNK